jgi:CheY-like chemotaxis protein
MSVRLLVVDDSKLARRITGEICKKILGVSSLSEACNGLEALEQIKAEKFDLMILDLNMPGMDGFEVLDKIGGMNERPKVIVASANVQEKAIKRALQKGASAFVKKPASAGGMKRAIAECGIVL